jgi:hypothetical protein
VQGKVESIAWTTVLELCVLLQLFNDTALECCSLVDESLLQVLGRW